MSRRVTEKERPGAGPWQAFESVDCLFEFVFGPRSEGLSKVCTCEATGSKDQAYLCGK